MITSRSKRIIDLIFAPIAGIFLGIFCGGIVGGIICGIFSFLVGTAILPAGFLSEMRNNPGKMELIENTIIFTGLIVGMICGLLWGLGQFLHRWRTLRNDVPNQRVQPTRLPGRQARG